MPPVDLEEVIIYEASLRSIIQSDTTNAKIPAGTLTPFHSSTLNFREYAPSGITTFSIRGTTPQQNSIYWNGFLVQNPMLGLNDLSLFPSKLFDEVVVSTSDRTDLLLTGSPGGVISFDNLIKTTKKRNGAIAFETTFDQNNNLQFNLKADHHIKNTHFLIRAINHQNKNHYTHPDRFGNQKEAEHASVLQQAILLKVHRPLGEGGEVDFNLWWQETDREIPPTLFQAASKATQFDRHFRGSFSYKKSFENVILNYKSAFFIDRLKYEDERTDEFSDSQVKDLQSILTLWWNTGLNIPVKFQAGFQNTHIKSDAYSKNHNDQNYFLSLSSNSGELVSDFRISLQLKQEFNSIINAPLLSNIQFQYRINKLQKLVLSFGNHFRKPSYNDLYWPVLGNTDLIPERGWNTDLSWQKRFSQSLMEKITLNAFLRETDDLIYWNNTGGMWRPENLSKIRSYGLEFRTRFELDEPGVPLGLEIGYDYIVSKLIEERFPDDPALNKQLPYQPHHSILGKLYFNWKGFTIHNSMRFVSERFTAADHGSSLESNLIVRASLAYLFEFQKTKIETAFFVDNLFNSKYQSVNHRPMPLRTVGINIIFNLNL
nr:hypothetical protein [Saprospiraceae bacterium]